MKYIDMQELEGMKEFIASAKEAFDSDRNLKWFAIGQPENGELIALRHKQDLLVMRISISQECYQIAGKLKYQLPDASLDNPWMKHEGAVIPDQLSPDDGVQAYYGRARLKGLAEQAARQVNWEAVTYWRRLK